MENEAKALPRRISWSLTCIYAIGSDNNNMPYNEEQGDERQLPSVDPEDFPEPKIVDPTRPAHKQGPQKEEPQPDEDDQRVRP